MVGVEDVNVAVSVVRLAATAMEPIPVAFPFAVQIGVEAQAVANVTATLVIEALPTIAMRASVPLTEAQFVLQDGAEPPLVVCPVTVRFPLTVKFPAALTQEMFPPVETVQSPRIPAQAKAATEFAVI